MTSVESAPAESGSGKTGVAPDGAAPVPDQSVITGLTDLLVKAVRALGAAGEADQASRLAAKAWWVLKDWPRQAERVNGTMHYLARLPPGGQVHDPAASPATSKGIA